MIAALAFGSPQRPDERVVRPAEFVARSTLPLSATCLVANGVREQLSHLLGRELEVDVSEPAIPTPRERSLLLDGALVAGVRGRSCDGFVLVRPADARRLAALAFGEIERSPSEALSEIERTTLDRILMALVPLCNTLCGTLGPVTRVAAERAAREIACYFEVRTTGPVRVAVGFGLTRDPPEAISQPLALDDLAEVELEGTVEIARGLLGVDAFSRLAAGATVVLDTPLEAQGTLRFGTVVFARGTCGVADGRSAISFAQDGANAA